MPHIEAFTDFPQLRTGGHIEPRQQPVATEPLDPALAALAATIQPLEDPGQLRGIEAFAWQYSRPVACLLFDDRL
jgi:hypothetical protein